jgi:hypothetical protein
MLRMLKPQLRLVLALDRDDPHIVRLNHVDWVWTPPDDGVEVHHQTFRLLE